MLHLAVLVLASVVADPTDRAVPPSAPEVPTWRFVADDRPVKVVVLAGSIGAWPNHPYADEIERLCRNVEVRNLSKTGLGAYPLRQRFKQQVLDNRRLDLDADDREHWLVYGGGINSIGMPEATNHHMKNTFVLAHRAGMKVLGLTVTPWGDLEDRRFRGARALTYRRATQAVADFVLGRELPREALGSYAARRPAGADAPWDPIEQPDIAIDLYDSGLRDRDAPLRDLEAMRTLLGRDPEWRRAHARESEETRTQALEADAQALAELPRWFLREPLRSFDHIHPNRDGHRIIAATMCPALPATWGCTCEPLEVAAATR